MHRASLHCPTLTQARDGYRTTSLLLWLNCVMGVALLASPVSAWSQNVPPTLIQGPKSQTVAVGSDVSFEATASGSLPLSFRFRKNPGGITLTNMILNQTNAIY